MVEVRNLTDKPIEWNGIIWEPGASIDANVWRIRESKPDGLVIMPAQSQFRGGGGARTLGINTRAFLRT